MNKGTSRRAPVHLRADARSLTGEAELLLSGELVHRLALVGPLDSAIADVVEPVFDTHVLTSSCLTLEVLGVHDGLSQPAL